MDVEEFKKYDIIYVIGHTNPDADSIFSSIILSNVLKKKGINAKFAILKKAYNYSYEDEKVITEYIKESPIVLENEDTEKYKFILVDHNDPAQSVNKGEFICAFDHHINIGKIDKCFSKEYTSTLLYIYDLFKEEYQFSEYEKKIIAISVICDSEYLSSSRFSKNDKKLFDSLNQNIDIDEFRKKYFKVTDLNKEIQEVCDNNYKKYNINEIEINRIIIKVYNENMNFLDKYIKYLLNKHGYWLLIWCEYDNKKTYIIFINNGILTRFEYDYINTSSVLTIKELVKRKII